jgi:hypothetical protein
MRRILAKSLLGMEYDVYIDVYKYQAILQVLHSDKYFYYYYWLFISMIDLATL